MNVDGSVAFVTGAHRGFGAALCRALLALGATTVYADARDPTTLTRPVSCPSSPTSPP